MVSLKLMKLKNKICVLNKTKKSKTYKASLAN